MPPFTSNKNVAKKLGITVPRCRKVHAAQYLAIIDATSIMIEKYLHVSPMFVVRYWKKFTKISTCILYCFGFCYIAKFFFLKTDPVNVFQSLDYSNQKAIV